MRMAMIIVKVVNKFVYIKILSYICNSLKHYTMKNITLKNLKVHETLSEETLCFSADLYENGKLIAHVSNRGCGGCNDILPAEGLTYKDVAHLDNLDAECEILTMAEEMNAVKKDQRNKFVLKKDDNIYTAKTQKNLSFAQLKKYGNYSTWLKNQLAMFEREGYQVLNTNL